jgi:hypothetical protein
MTIRSISPSLAAIIESLELEQPALVSTQDIASLAKQVGLDWPAGLVVRRLRERGWLLDVGVRGVWEFIPAARAGVYGAGDRMISLRAALHRNPEAHFVVAEESAAFLLGYSTRPPSREVIAVPQDESVPPALRRGRVVRWHSHIEPIRLNGLLVWPVETLLAAMASRPSGYHDWPNVGEWIGKAARDADPDKLRLELHDKGRAAWARMAYLLWLAACEADAELLLADAPEGKGPFYLGDRDKDGTYVRKFEVIDSTAMEVTPF